MQYSNTIFNIRARDVTKFIQDGSVDSLPDCLPLFHYFGKEMKEVLDLFVLTGRSRNRNRRIGCRIQSQGSGFDICSPSSALFPSKHKSTCTG